MGKSLRQMYKDRNTTASNKVTSVANKTNSTVQRLLKQAPAYGSSLGGDFQLLRKQAMGKGPLPQFEAQRGVLEQQGIRNQERQDADTAGRVENAYSQLAMGGGLSSGARERVAQGGMQDTLFAKQNLRAADQAALGALGVQEAGAKLDLQKGVAQAGVEEQNRRQDFMMDRYKFKAETTAGLAKADAERAVAAANKPSCFAPQTMITMHDGSLKAISEIAVGDKVDGGVVYAVQMSVAPGSMYCYAGKVFVTGGHAVNENGVWKRVRNAGLAVKAETALTCVFNIATTDHYVIAEGMKFGDMHESDYFEHFTSDESIDYLNGFPFVLEEHTCSTQNT